MSRFVTPCPKWWRGSWDARAEASQILAKKYPTLFTNVRCGVSIGLGWVPLVSELADKIVERRADVCFEQVKEKFGTLRVYAYGDTCDDDFLESAIDEAESKSAVTCEFCGAPGTLTSGGWLKTLCAEHAEEWSRR